MALVNSRVNSLGRQQYQPNMTPGYTGFVPRFQTILGHTYSPACNRALARFEQDQWRDRLFNKVIFFSTKNVGKGCFLNFRVLPLFFCNIFRNWKLWMAGDFATNPNHGKLMKSADLQTRIFRNSHALQNHR